jgi:hypothetical protein
MKMAIKATGSALLVMTMLAAGCGGRDVPVNEKSNVATRVDGLTCTENGVSPELAALSGGPYQNCQGGDIPRSELQSGTQSVSGCCGDLLRTCKVTGYSTLNTLTCYTYDGTCTRGGVSPELAALPGGPYQNCQGGTIPRIDLQSGTQSVSGCCGDLVRTCKVTGYSTLNTLTCL